MRRLLLAVLTIATLTGSISASAQSKAHHVIFAVTSPSDKDWQLTLGNIRNLIHGFAPDAVEIEVVAYGPGIAMVRKSSSVGAEIDALEKTSVQFVACENSMKRMQITKADLHDGVGTVPSGIVEVVKRQEQGWSYIKAGQ